VERGEVFLMGRVTEREANRATDIAREVSGVKKVVRAFEIISEEDLARITPKKQ
jgi:osmotically-inducible protein OsmY